MIMKKLISLALGLAIIVTVASCEKEEENERTGSSHNAGRNCLGCHPDFKLAGSVYNTSLSGIFAGAKIKVTTLANGQGSVVTTLTSDKSGNFYTGNSINFGTGVFVSAEGTSGSIMYMNSAITSGACNTCHGSSTSKIIAE